MERRFIPHEVRMVEDEAGVRHVRGYGIVFEQWSEDLGGFREQVDSGAVTKTLQEADIRGLFNHEASYILGRMRAGTMTVEVDDVGVRYDIALPDTSYARDLVVSLERGDVSGSSFGFDTVRDDWDKDAEGRVIRRLREIRLFDMGPVTFPAYPQTSAEARSMAQTLTGAPPEDGHPPDEGGDEGEEARARDLQRRRRELQLMEHGGVL